jgi:hypothetical protein
MSKILKPFGPERARVVISVDDNGQSRLECWVVHPISGSRLPMNTVQLSGILLESALAQVRAMWQAQTQQGSSNNGGASKEENNDN